MSPMSHFWNWMTRNPNAFAFKLGLALLFIGLSLSVSIATALVWTGAVMIVDAMLASFLESWLMTRKVE